MEGSEPPVPDKVMVADEVEPEHPTDPGSADLHEAETELEKTVERQAASAEPKLDAHLFKPKGEQRPGTLLYEVKLGETIRQLAVRHSMSESEIGVLNRIVCGSVFPGQLIYLRDPKSSDYEVPLTESVEKRAGLEDPGRSPGAGENGVDAKDKSASRRSSQPGRINSDGMVEVERLTTHTLENFVNNTMAVLKVLYVTDGRGLVPGVLEANCDYIRFTPDPGMIVDEYGTAEYTLHFDLFDLLQPITQSEVPDLPFSTISVGPGGAHHHSLSTDDTPEARRKNSSPQYLQLRVRLVYGQEPTPSTTASYWFAVMPEWIDPLFELLWKHCELAAKESWEVVDQMADTDITVENLVLHLDTNVSVTGRLLDPSDMVDDAIVKSLSPFMPTQQQFADWTRSYSTYIDGKSISHFMRKQATVSGPTVLLVKDGVGHVFGAFTTSAWRVNDGYYGGGESFLFKYHPVVRTYRWTGNNSYFMMSNGGAIMIGGGTGIAGLWIDEHMMHGSSGITTTFDNDILSSTPDFMVDGIEVWSFVDGDF